MFVEFLSLFAGQFAGDRYRAEFEEFFMRSHKLQHLGLHASALFVPHRLTISQFILEHTPSQTGQTAVEVVSHVCHRLISLLSNLCKRTTFKEMHSNCLPLVCRQHLAHLQPARSPEYGLPGMIVLVRTRSG